MITYRKVGGLHFLRIGRLQISACLVRKKPETSAAPARAPAVDDYGLRVRASHAASTAMRKIYGSGINTCEKSRADWMRVYRAECKALGLTP
jgi:hypothetical protein